MISYILFINITKDIRFIFQEGRDKRKLEEKLYRYEEAERKRTKAVHPTVVSDKQRDSLAPPDSFF